jgi:hypothetical protein
LTFTPVPGAPTGQLPSTNGRYVAIQEANGVLVSDQQTGQSTLETTAGQGGSCHTYATAFAGPWLAGGCTTGDEHYVEQLYSLATGAWLTVDLPDECVWQGGSGYSGASQCTVGPAGADWLSWDETCWNCGTYGGLVALSQDDAPLTQFPPTTPTTVIDLDSPNLIAPLCRPLRSTAASHLIVNSSAQFIIDQAPLGRSALAVGRHGTVYLERCGSHMRHRLTAYPITGNRSELLFPSRGATLPGIFLRSRRKFVIHVPRALLSPDGGNQRLVVYAARLSMKTLYIVGANGELWQAAAPQAPPRSASPLAPSRTRF